MFVTHYLPKILTALFGGLFIFAGIYTFDDGLLFDRLFICILIFTAVVCRKNINVLGVVMIMVLQRLLEETAWSISELDQQQIIKPVFYLLSILACWKIKYDNVSKILLFILVCSIGSEFYWIYSETKAPQIYWYVALSSLCLFIRHLIFMRVSYTEDFYPNRAESINLDWHIYKIYGLGVLINTLITFEYIVRDTLGYKEVQFIYHFSPYMLRVLATYAIWVIFLESYKLVMPKLLKA